MDNKIIVSLIWFIFVFIFIYLLEILFFNRLSKKSKNKKSKSHKISTEIVYIISRYNLDIDKLPLNKLVNEASLIAAFDIALVYSIATYFIKNIYLELLCSLALLIPLIIFSYGLIGRKYVKKYRKVVK